MSDKQCHLLFEMQLCGEEIILAWREQNSTFELTYIEANWQNKHLTILPITKHIQECANDFLYTIIYISSDENSKFLENIETFFKKYLNVKHIY